jgi:hypothetical protein
MAFIYLLAFRLNTHADNLRKNWADRHCIRTLYGMPKFPYLRKIPGSNLILKMGHSGACVVLDTCVLPAIRPRPRDTCLFSYSVISRFVIWAIWSVVKQTVDMNITTSRMPRHARREQDIKNKITCESNLTFSISVLQELLHAQPRKPSVTLADL